MDLPTQPVVVLTRESNDNQALAGELEERGISVFELPCVQTRLLKVASPSLKHYAGILFTSRRGVAGFVNQPDNLQNLKQQQSRIVIGVVGQATQEALAAYGIVADLIAVPPEGFHLATLVKKRLPRGSRLLIVRGNLRAGAMDRALTDFGCVLDPLLVYENLAPVIPALEPFPVAAVFVASPSAALRLLKRNPWLKSRLFLAIGPTTAHQLESIGVEHVLGLNYDKSTWASAIETACRKFTDQEET